MSDTQEALLARLKPFFTWLVLLPGVWVMTASAAEGESLTVYSGRSEELVGRIIERFREHSGVEVLVRYGKTAEMAATILEEGENTPADVFFAQDAGALGALAQAGRFTPLPASILDRVERRFRAPDGTWVGISGRARVVVYNRENVSVEELPDDIHDLCEPKWQGRVGWAPPNGSFQTFVTALRVTEGEQGAREWLECMRDNETKVYPKNTPIVAAVGAGEIDLGLANHYYLFRFLKEHGTSFPARNHVLPGGDAGTLVNVAGVGILDATDNEDTAVQFVEFLLGPEAQQYFTNETYEYPLVSGIEVNPFLVPLREIQTPVVDLNKLQDLEGTLQLLHEMNIL